MGRNTFFSALLLTFLALPWAYAAQVEEIKALMDAGQYRGALKQADELIAQSDKSDPRARFLKGQILTRLNRSDEAIGTYLQLTQDFPDLPEPYNNLATLYMSAGDLDKARLALLNALNTHNSYATAYRNLSSVYAEMAGRAYRQALETDVQGPQLVLTTSDKLNTWQEPTPITVASTQQATQSGTNTVVANQGVLVATANASPTTNQTTSQTASQSDGQTTDSSTAGATNTTGGNSANEQNKDSGNSATQVAKVSETPVDDEQKKDQGNNQGNDQDSEEKKLIKVVNEWASAWSKKDVKTYLSYYAKEFKPDDPELTHQAWVKQRQGRLRWRKYINVKVSSPKIVVNGNSAEISFKQSYKSDTYQDQVRKTLSMKRVKDSWKIVREKSDA